jgi:hypothetical protein
LLRWALWDRNPVTCAGSRSAAAVALNSFLTAGSLNPVDPLGRRSRGRLIEPITPGERWLVGSGARRSAHPFEGRLKWTQHVGFHGLWCAGAPIVMLGPEISPHHNRCYWAIIDAAGRIDAVSGRVGLFSRTAATGSETSSNGRDLFTKPIKNIPNVLNQVAMQRLRLLQNERISSGLRQRTN